MQNNRTKLHKFTLIFSLIALTPVFVMQGLFVDAKYVLAAKNKFVAGDKVLVSVPALRVRLKPSLKSKNLGAQNKNAKGVILAGPINANGYNWWKVDYGVGIDGWSAENYLQLNTIKVLGASGRFGSAAAKFKIGGKVVVSGQSSPVRSRANLNSKFLGNQRLNAKGTVLAGPNTANGFTWWQINYDTGIDGWSIDKYLSIALSAPRNTSANPAITSIPTSNSGPSAIIGLSPDSKLLSYKGSNSIPRINPAPTPSPAPIPPTVTPTPAPGHVSAPAPANAALQWGAYVGDASDDLTNFESLVGKKVNLYADFEGWNASFPSEFSSKVGQQGKTLIIFWEPSFGFDNIINGSQDSYIKTFADGAKAYGYPVILVPFDEMNLNEEAWGYGQNNNSAQKFKTAWMHIHDLFAGATNVKFGLAYNNVSVPVTAGNNFADYYPGDAYVDYMGVDGFNFGSPWQSFGQVFDEAMRQLSLYNKPIYIFSMASIAGSQKASWITEGLGTHIKTYTNLAGWVWFNQGGSPNWLVDSDNASLSAFRAILP